MRTLCSRVGKTRIQFLPIMVFFILCGSLKISKGQAKLVGMVRDLETDSALPGATIYLPDLRQGTATNLDGKYMVEEIPPGVHMVQVSFVGYETYVKQIRFNQGNETLDVELNPTVTEAHEVVVSGGYPSSQDNNAVKIDVLSSTDLFQGGSNNIAEELEKTPGINQLSTGIGIGKPVIRGLSSNRVLVVYDGIRMENQQWGTEHGLGMDQLGIGSVELIKGPASLIYGSDALGGVVHIVPEKNATGGEIKGQLHSRYFSNTSGNQTSVGIKGNQGGIFWSLNGSNSIHADYRDGRSNNIGNTRFKGMAFNGDIGLIRKWGILELRYNRNQQELGLTSSEVVDLERKYNPETPKQDIANDIIVLKTSIFLNRVKLRLNASRQFNNRKEFEDEGLALHMLLETYTLELKGSYSLSEKTQIILGSQGMLQTNENRGEEVLIPDALTRTLGFFTLYNSEVNDRFNVNAGIRYDMSYIGADTTGLIPSASGEQDFGFSNFSGAIGGTFEMNEKIFFRGNIASGFRSPNLSELTSFGVHEGANRFELGNPSIINEQNLEFDLGTHLHSNHVNAEIAGFYNRVWNFIRLEPTNGSFVQEDGEILPVFVYNQGDAYLFGGEITLDIHPHPLDWLHYELSYETVTGQTDNGEYLPLMPANSIGNEIKIESDIWKFSKAHVFVGMKHVFNQNKVAPAEIPTNSYNLWNLGIGGEIELHNQIISLGCVVTNIFDEKYFSHLSRLKTEGILNQGRNLSVYLKIPFQILRKN